MSEDFNFEIQIPSDNDGYVLLKCPNCGVYFKMMPEDIKDEGILEIYCPSCGLAGESYITEDVIELAVAVAKNKAMDLIYNEFKKMERRFNNGLITFQVGKRPVHEPENPIHSSIDAMEIVIFSCCNRMAKVKLLLKITGCYCPFCGVKNYEVE